MLSIKKWLSGLTAAVVLLCGMLFAGNGSVLTEFFSGVTEMTASADEYTTYGDLTYAYLDDGTIEITDCDTSVTEAEIPSEIDGVAVTSIGDDAFSYCRTMTEITIPDSVTSIGDGAFQSCILLTSFVIPDGVECIGDSVFYYCKGLTTVTISQNVTSIGIPSFYGCNNLTAIEVDENNENYSGIDGVLFDKDQSTLITFPPGKQDISYVISVK